MDEELWRGLDAETKLLLAKVDLARTTGTDLDLKASEIDRIVRVYVASGRKTGIEEAGAECARLGLRVTPPKRADFDMCVTALKRLAEKVRP